MKKSILCFTLMFLLIILLNGLAYSANELFRSQSTGNWNANSTWQMSTNGGTTWFAATSTPSDTSGSITIQNFTTVTVTANVTANQMTIDSGGVLSVSSSIILTIVAGSGNDLSLSKGSILNGSGIVRTQGTIEFNLRAGSAFNASLNVNTGITYAYDQTSPFIGRLYGNVTIDAGATLNGGNITGRDLYLYGSVINNGTLTVTSTGASMTMNGPSLTNNGTINHAGVLYFDSTTSLSGAGTYTPANIAFQGNITLINNITFSPGSYISVASGTVLNPNGNIMTITSGIFYVDGTITAPGTVRTQNSVTIFANALSQFNASLNVNTGTTIATDDNSPYIGRLYGNVTIDAGATLNGGNISGRDLYLYGSVINSGTLTATSTGGTLRIKCPSLTNNGIINPAGTFYFDTTTSLSGSGSFTSAANFTVNANVTLNSTHQMSSFNINSGAVFNISNRLLKLTASNPITATGTFTTTGSKIEYNGTAAQNISSTNITYAGLRINNPDGTILSGNVPVNDTLSVIVGDLDLAGRIITLSSAGYLTETPDNTIKGTTGYITTTRNLGTPSSLNVGGLGAVLTAASTLGNTEIRRGHGVQTGGSIKRYFDITPTNNSGLSATLVFKYDDSELNLRPESTLKLLKSTNGGTNFTIMGGTVNTTLNEITLSGITSFSRWTADSSGVSAVINMAIEGYYNASTNRLRMQDTVRIYLRNTLSPYAIVDSAKTLLDSVNLRAACVFPNAPNGIYYIQTKHRNSIETWSRAGGETYSTTNTLNYDFTSSAPQAFGSNQVQVDATPLRFAIYSGDILQDGIIDGSDGLIADNDAAIFLAGYVRSDVNGDRFVDGTDAAIVDNNAANFVAIARP